MLSRVKMWSDGHAWRARRARAYNSVIYVHRGSSYFPYDWNSPFQSHTRDQWSTSWFGQRSKIHIMNLISQIHVSSITFQYNVGIHQPTSIIYTTGDPDTTDGAVYVCICFTPLGLRSIVMSRPTFCLFVCLSARITRKPRSRTLPNFFARLFTLNGMSGSRRRP